MAHRYKLATARKIRLSVLEHEHDHGGTQFAADDVVEHDGFAFLATRNEGEVGRFFLHRARRGIGNFYTEESNGSGIVYRPPDPTMTADDIMGSRYAEDTGTHWKFHHCSPEEHIDFAAEARTFTEAQFAIRVSALCAAAVRASEVNEGPTGRRAGALALFAEKAGEKAYADVLDQPLGHFHKNPHDDHKRVLAVDACELLLTEWKKLATVENATDRDKGNYDDVKADVAAVVEKLTTTHAIQTFHESRLAAPKFAAPKVGPQQSWTAGQAITPFKVPAPAGYPAPTFSAQFLPTGIQLDGKTGEVTGTAPNSTGQGTITVKATNSEGSDTYTFNYTIVAAQPGE